MHNQQQPVKQQQRQFITLKTIVKLNGLVTKRLYNLLLGRFFFF